ncbi:MAG: hypothetical protein KDA86_07170 [Planctomycetaceae bacterium]|nr:hypothetical protein [Planctomycetaceae bacterium]
MIGRSRFYLATVTLLALLAGIGFAGIDRASFAESFSPVTSQATSPHSGPETALTAEQLPPSQFGAYQYLTPDSYSGREQGLQFIDPPTSGTIPDYFQLFGHASLVEPSENLEQSDILQTQYPLDNRSPATNEDEFVHTSPEPRWVPPLVATQEPIAEPQQCDWITISSTSLDATYVAGSGNSLGFTTVTGRVVFESPRFKAFSVRPQVGWHNLNGPRSTDLPSQLYDVTIEMRMYWPFGDRWLGEFAIAPGLFTDFQNTTGDAIRIVGRAVGYYRWSPDLQLAIGAAYLDRQDVAALPVAGLVWTPTQDDRVELLIPRPRFAHRFRNDPSQERWIYVAGEFGGGSWGIERTNGTNDIATYRDFRLITGIEFKFTDRSDWRVEGGYVFGREVEYLSNVGNYQPRNTTMIRAALTF